LFNGGHLVIMVRPAFEEQPSDQRAPAASDAAARQYPQRAFIVIGGERIGVSFRLSLTPFRGNNFELSHSENAFLPVPFHRAGTILVKPGGPVTKRGYSRGFPRHFNMKPGRGDLPGQNAFIAGRGGTDALLAMEWCLTSRHNSPARSRKIATPSIPKWFN
jgi:hypothetical protein